MIVDDRFWPPENPTPPSSFGIMYTILSYFFTKRYVRKRDVKRWKRLLMLLRTTSVRIDVSPSISFQLSVFLW